MKKVLSRIRKGQIVSAEIVEAISSAYFIVSFAGDLVRIKNGSGRTLRPGEWVELLVVSIDPVSFKLLNSSVGRATTHGQGLNRFV